MRREMLRTFGALAVTVSLCAPVAAQTTLEAPLERAPGFHDARAAADAQQSMATLLISREGGAQVRGFALSTTLEEARRMDDAPEDVGPLLVGVAKPLAAAVRFDRLDLDFLTRVRTRRPTAANSGALQVNRRGFTWFTTIASEDATGMRLQLADVTLPEGTELYIYTLSGEAFGPYRAGDLREEQLWTPTLRGSQVRLQIRYRGREVKQTLARTQLDIAQVVHLGPKFFLGGAGSEAGAAGRAFCSFNASCVQNAECSTLPSAIAPAQDGIAHLQYVKNGGAFICSGGLLNDTDTSSSIPYLLTANHCFSSQSSASSLEAFFQFTTPCGGSCYNPDGAVPRVVGSTLLSTSSTGDYTFVQLNGSAPAGSTFLGWTTSAVANSNNTNLYRISHPKGAPQAYSTQRVDTSAGTCGGIPRGNWIYSRDTFGATEGGSSGSPVMNGSGQVVGQLTGACGTQTSNPCNSTANATIDGALANYYSNIAQWLNPTPGNCHSGSNGGASYCTNSCTCDEGEGDCDSNAQCDAGLICATDTGPNYGFASWVDVCEAPSCHPGAPGSASYCRTNCTCDAGEGDCDNDAECGPGLECVNNVGPNYGFASWVDVCEPAQSNPNSCVGNCGSQAPGGCWCDSQCASFGDCCSDKFAVCG